MAECLAELVDIMRGKTGPYTRQRYQAVIRILDMFSGRPREAPVPERDNPKGAVRELVDRCKDGSFEKGD